jgi:hypothetical protein
MQASYFVPIELYSVNQLCNCYGSYSLSPGCSSNAKQSRTTLSTRESNLFTNKASDSQTGRYASASSPHFFPLREYKRCFKSPAPKTHGCVSSTGLPEQAFDPDRHSTNVACHPARKCESAWSFTPVAETKPPGHPGSKAIVL